MMPDVKNAPPFGRQEAVSTVTVEGEQALPWLLFPTLPRLQQVRSGQIGTFVL